MKKYKLTKEKIEHNGRTLYRIEALIDFSNVKKGQKGGFIEKEDNLSHEGKAWVYDNACVYGDAWVSGNARVYGNAWVNKPIMLVSGYFYHTKKKSEKIEIVDTYEEGYETLACNPKIEEEKPRSKRVKIRLTGGEIVEGEIVE